MLDSISANYIHKNPCFALLGRLKHAATRVPRHMSYIRTMMRLVNCVVCLSLLGAAADTYAQLKGKWTKEFISDTCVGMTALGADSLGVMAITNKPYLLGSMMTTWVSSDSGRHSKSQSFYTRSVRPWPNNFNTTNFFSARLTDDRRANFTTIQVGSGNQIAISLNNGLNWGPSPNLLINGRIAVTKMFNPDSGYQIVYEIDWTNQKTSFYGQAVYDSGFGLTYPALWNFTVDGRVQDCEGLVISRDSFFLSMTIDGRTKTARTTDGGNWWTFKDYDSSFGKLKALAPGKRPGVMFAVWRPGQDDAAVSFDFGTSWGVLNTPLTGGRAQRIYESDTGVYWLMIGRTPYDVMVNLHTWVPPAHVDTLYYTTDAGSTWHIDSSFFGDTVVAMCWPTPTLGYVLFKRDGKIYFGRWDAAQPTRDVAKDRGYSKHAVSIYPNPASDKLTLLLESGRPRSAELFDLLGHTVHRWQLDPHVFRAELVLPAHLSSGAYSIVITYSNGERSQAKVVIDR
jgi:hypothetical protein